MLRSLDSTITHVWKSASCRQRAVESLAVEIVDRRRKAESVLPWDWTRRDRQGALPQPCQEVGVLREVIPTPRTRLDLDELDDILHNKGRSE